MVFNDREDNREDKKTPERQHVYMSLSFSVCVCLCNGEIIVSFCVHVCDDAVIQPLCVLVCKCLSAFVSVSLCARIEEPSRAWISVWHESTASVHYSPNNHSSILGKVQRIWMHLHWGLLRLIQYYVIYLQLSGKVEEEEVTLSSSISATSHVIHNFQEHRLRVCFSLSESESMRTRARERDPTFLQRTSWWSKRKKTRCWLRPYGW